MCNVCIIHCSILGEITILHLLRRGQKRRQCCRRRWSVRPLNTSRSLDGEFQSLVLAMREIDDERHFQLFRMSFWVFDELFFLYAIHGTFFVYNARQCPHDFRGYCNVWSVLVRFPKTCRIRTEIGTKCTQSTDRRLRSYPYVWWPSGYLCGTSPLRWFRVGGAAQ